MKRIKNPFLAEDAVQDVFEAVLNGRASFEGRSAVRTWLVGVLKHKAIDALRAVRHHEPLDENGSTHDGGQPVCSRPQPERAYELRQALERATVHLDALPSALRSALQLYVVDDLALPTVCEQLSITPGNLGVRLHRARAMMRESAAQGASPSLATRSARRTSLEVDADASW